MISFNLFTELLVLNKIISLVPYCLHSLLQPWWSLRKLLVISQFVCIVPRWMQRWQVVSMELIVNHTLFLTWFYTGLIYPRGESKTEILFWSKPLFIFENPETFEDADLSDVIIDEQSYIPIVNHFKFLGNFIRRGFTDERDVDAKIFEKSWCWTGLFCLLIVMVGEILLIRLVYG